VYADDDGHVVTIESEVPDKTKDKTLYFQTRPNPSSGSDRLPDAVTENVENSASSRWVTVSKLVNDELTEVQVNPNSSAYLDKTTGVYRVEDQAVSGTRAASYAQNVELSYTNVTVIEAPSDSNAPMLRVNYDGYTFLIALMKSGADWDHFRSKLTTDNYRADTVTVFIGTEAANRALGDPLSPRSSVVLSSDGVPDYTCGDSTQGIYNVTDGDLLNYRVDEENRLFGPVQTPDAFC